MAQLDVRTARNSLHLTAPDNTLALDVVLDPRRIGKDELAEVERKLYDAVAVAVEQARRMKFVHDVRTARAAFYALASGGQKDAEEARALLEEGDPRSPANVTAQAILGGVLHGRGWYEMDLEITRPGDALVNLDTGQVLRNDTLPREMEDGAELRNLDGSMPDNLDTAHELRWWRYDNWRDRAEAAKTDHYSEFEHSVDFPEFPVDVQMVLDYV